MKCKVNIKKHLGVLLLMGCFCSCVTEYTPEGVKVSSLLVVEGVITNDVTLINLTRSVGLVDDIENIGPVTNASLYVECSDGVRLQTVSYKGNGTYEIITGVLNPNLQYQLYISVDGEEYRSEYLNPLITPNIDSISLSKAGQGEPVHLCVSTHDPSDQSKYYMWSYQEIWEVQSFFYADGRFSNGPGSSVIKHDTLTSNNLYYCWRRDSSRIFLLGSTSRLTENRLKEEHLAEFVPSDKRFSTLYYVNLTQNQIRKEAYDYFYNLKKNIEQSGGLFSSMPTDIRGNIHCITNPSELVIGYIEVSNTIYSERFFPTSSSIYEFMNDRTCQVLTPEEYMALHKEDKPYYGIYEMESNAIISYAPRDCVDCRFWGTKDRPSFWPTDHY